MENLKLEDIQKILEKDSYGNWYKEYGKKDFYEEIQNFFNSGKEKKAVLGLDIYQYSKYKGEKQDLIPVILKEIIDKVITDFEEYEPESYKRNKTFFKNHIDTGDGGYWFFDNPLDALLFAIYINATVHAFNSYILKPMVREHIGIFNVRFALTYDEIFELDNKFYGTAIISNARIMSKDKLNRLLTDENTYDWFLHEINGVENVRAILYVNDQKNKRIKELLEKGFDIKDEKDYLLNKYKKSFILGIDKKQRPSFSNVISTIICQKLEQINVKDDNFKVYNLFLQYNLTISNYEKEEYITPKLYYSEALAVSLGNLNTNGI